MKQYKTAIIAIVLIVAAVAAFLLVKNVGSDDPGATQPPEENNSGYVFPFSADQETQSQIVGIECVGTDHLVLEKNNDRWTCTTYPEITIVEANVKSLIAKLYAYDGAIVYEGVVTDAVRTDFGLDGQTRLAITMKDGTVYTAIFGGMNTASTAHYIWLEGSETIYLYAKGFQNGVLLNKGALISKTIFDFSDPGQVVRATVWKDNQRTLELSAKISGEVDASRVWTMSYPLQRKGNNENIETWLNKVLAISIKDIAEVQCEDLATYGLSPSAYSVSFTSPEKTITLHIGNKTKDGTQYYATVDDGRDVYLINESSVTFKDLDPLTYADKVVYMVMYTELSAVRITMNGVTRTMQYEFDKDNKPTYIFEGHRISDNLSEAGEGFTRLLTSLYFLEIKTLELSGAPEVPGEILCEIEYELRDGTKNTVVCAKRDETTMYYYVNGKYVGGYGPQYYLTSTAEKYGVQGCLDSLMKIMKLA